MNKKNLIIYSIILIILSSLIIFFIVKSSIKVDENIDISQNNTQIEKEVKPTKEIIKHNAHILTFEDCDTIECLSDSEIMCYSVIEPEFSCYYDIPKTNNASTVFEISNLCEKFKEKNKIIINSDYCSNFDLCEPFIKESLKISSEITDISSCENIQDFTLKTNCNDYFLFKDAVSSENIDDCNLLELDKSKRICRALISKDSSNCKIQE